MRPQDGRVVSNFIVQALKEEGLSVYGDGTQTRSFCYVSDLVEGLARLALADPESDESVGASGLDGIHGPVNLGNPVEMTVADIARMILRLTGSSSRIVHKPLPVDDPKVRRPDIARAQNLLCWIPQVSLEDGLRKTIEHFRQAEIAETDRPGDKRGLLAHVI